MMQVQNNVAVSFMRRLAGRRMIALDVAQMVAGRCVCVAHQYSPILIAC